VYESESSLPLADPTTATMLCTDLSSIQNDFGLFAESFYSQAPYQGLISVKLVVHS